MQQNTSQRNEEEDRRTEAILEEYRLKRGPSLMEAHTDKLLAQKPEKTVRKPFDRDRVREIE